MSGAGFGAKGGTIVRRLSIVMFAALLAFGLVGTQHVAADAPVPALGGGAGGVTAQDAAPTCFNPADSITYTATKWLTSPGTLTGTSGDDVLVGSTGSDTIKGLGGNDIICSNDTTGGFFYGLDNIDAGSGNDVVHGAGTLHGGSGNDSIYDAGGTGYGDSGNDYVNPYYYSNGDGGSGNDTVQSTAYGAFQLLGGSGNDTILNDAGASAIDCGSNVDSVRAGNVANPVHCEKTVP